MGRFLLVVRSRRRHHQPFPRSPWSGPPTVAPARATAFGGRRAGRFARRVRRSLTWGPGSFDSPAGSGAALHCPCVDTEVALHFSGSGMCWSKREDGVSYEKYYGADRRNSCLSGPLSGTGGRVRGQYLERTRLSQSPCRLSCRGQSPQPNCRGCRPGVHKAGGDPSRQRPDAQRRTGL